MAAMCFPSQRRYNPEEIFHQQVSGFNLQQSHKEDGWSLGVYENPKAREAGNF